MTTTAEAPTHAAQAPLPQVTPVAALDDTRPVLPPHASAPPPSPSLPRSLWRHWPTITIAVAALAIVVAVVLMVWPTGSSSERDGAAGTRRLPPPPAPERMDTNPLPTPAPRPPPSGVDPWSSRGAVPSAPLPPQRADLDEPSVDDPDVADADDADDAQPDDFDPFGNMRPWLAPRGGLSGGLRGSNLGSAQFMFTLLGRLCDRARQCGGPIDQMCTLVDGFGPMPPPPSCAPAQRCLEVIDQLDVCSGSTSMQIGLTRVFTTVQDCMDAMTC